MAGLAAHAAASLSESHYDVLGTGNAVAPSASTIIQYSSPAGAAAAKALAQVIPDAQIQQVARGHRRDGRSDPWFQLH